MEKSHKKKIIIISAAVLVIAVVAMVVFLIFFHKKESYRIVKVYEVSGDATITREGVGEIEAYQDMVLDSGDKVVLKSGNMTLRLDDDKYVYVEPDTEFELIASGSSANSKTRIELSRGAITNEIQNPLSEDSSYEVNTPNANMSVRGTKFRVYIYEVDGIRYTKVSVWEGKVESRLRYTDGSLSKDAVMVTKGKEVTIYDDNAKTDYVGDPVAIQEGKTLLERSQETSTQAGPYTVTFMYNGSVFGTQIVEKGGLATEPGLIPAQSGSWDFDFSTEINSDTTIEWK